MIYSHTPRARQTWIVLFLLTCSVTVMMLRLAAVQLISGKTYREQADANRFYSVRIPKERGVFYDRYGLLLTANVPIFSRIENPHQIFSNQVRVSRKEGLQLLATDSARVQPGLERMYPLASASAHVVGYVSPATAEDLQTRQVAVQDTVGRYGLEKVLDTELQGVAGQEIFEINALGRKMKKMSTIPADAGREQDTSLDGFLQAVAAQALEGKKGSVIIEDTTTGGILALVNAPSFDPNVFTHKELEPEKEAERQEKIRTYLANPDQPFFDRALTGEYPPGSVFKLVTAIAGLQSGALTTKTEVKDEGVLKIDQYSFGNWYYSQYGRVEGSISLVRAIARSNDIYFYKAAEWIGADTLARFARDFGYGSPTGSQLPGERAGFVPTPAWKESLAGDRWYLGNTYHFGIGQGDLLVTPIQVSQMTQTLAQRGNRCQPTLAEKSNPACQNIGVEDKYFVPVIAGMVAVCSSGGTAYPFFSWNEQYAANASPDPYTQVQNGMVACKTGTAEFGGVTELGKRKTHGWFTMFVGTDAFLREQLAAVPQTPPPVTASLQNAADFTSHEAWLRLVKEQSFPKTIAITVLVESDENQPYAEGSKDAAPVAYKIIQWMAGK